MQRKLLLIAALIVSVIYILGILTAPTLKSALYVVFLMWMVKTLWKGKDNNDESENG